MRQRPNVAEKMASIEAVKKRCYEELSQNGFEIYQDPEYVGHLDDSSREKYGLSILHSYEYYRFYIVAPNKTIDKLVALIFVEWKYSAENLDPTEHPWRFMDTTFKQTMPKISTFQDLVRELKNM
jgi:hypothetical protein